jgi:kumamolisin
MSEKVSLEDSVVRLPAQPGTDSVTGLTTQAVEAADLEKEVSILVSLRLPESRRAELEARIARGETVSPEELASRYGAAASERARVRTWVESEGLAYEGESSDGSGVYVRGKASAVAQALGVNFVRVIQDGETYLAARDAPSIPSELADTVRAIVGLQPYRHPQKPRYARGVTPDATTTATGYTVAQIAHAYGADQTGLDGSGQIIAILIDTLPLDGDVEQFWKLNGTTSNISRITKLNVGGGTLPPIEGEESLDVEWTSGLATGADIRVYAAGGLDWVSLDKAIDRLISDFSTYPTMRQLSISLGLGETYMQSSAGEVDTQHTKFTNLAALGVNVFVASGDGGSNPDQSGGTSGPLQVDYAASDPSVIGVGGTTLTLDGAGNVTSEIGWSQGGGGLSILFSRPTWQEATGLASGTQRAVPDISATADPRPGGVTVINGQAQSVGGTSWATPVCAAFCALINQARITAGKGPLPALGPLLYPLQGSAALRDITEGSNGAYRAGAGYDLVTGLGVFDLPGLLAALA